MSMMGIWRAGVEGNGLHVWDQGLHKFKQRQEDNRSGNRAIDGDHADDDQNDSRSEAKPNFRGGGGVREGITQERKTLAKGKRLP